MNNKVNKVGSRRHYTAGTRFLRKVSPHISKNIAVNRRRNGVVPRYETFEMANREL